MPEPPYLDAYGTLGIRESARAELADRRAAPRDQTTADAVFTILESEGLIGHAADRALAACASDGLQPGGWRAQVSLNEAHRLPSGPDCSGQSGVFALPANRSRP
jgi:hypothetical protein